jgi:hypothetical protein
MGGSYLFEGVVALKNEQGEVHLYGNKLKKYVLEWMDQCRNGQFQGSFQDYFSQKLNEDDEVKSLVEKHRVRYFNPEELKQTETTIVDGRLQQIGLGSQDNSIKPLQPGKTPYAFVIMDVVENEELKTKLYLAPKTRTAQGKIQHSSFPRGGSVKSSGLIFVNQRLDGTLSISLSNRSGHYRPTTQELIVVLDLLKSQGYDISTIYIDYVKCRPLAELTGFKWGLSTQRADIWLQNNR